MVAQAGRDADEPTDGLHTEERDEMRRLRRENRRLREERDDPRRGPLRDGRTRRGHRAGGQVPRHALKCAMR